MNKSKSIFLLLLISIVIQSSAQTATNQSKKTYVKFGPKVGLDLNISNQDLPSSTQLTYELKDNYQVGGFLQFGRKLYFQPEFMYSVVNTTDDQNVLTAFEFYSLPVHIGLKFFDIGLLSMHLSAGAVYTFQSGDALIFEKERIEYQLGAGIDIFDFITTDVRYTLKNNVELSQQINDFSTQGGVINFTVGLKL